MNMTRARIAVLTLAAGLLCGPNLLAQGHPVYNEIADLGALCQAPTFVHGFIWEQAITQPVLLADGSTATKMGEAAGGRLVAGVGFGSVGLEARVDVSGLKQEFAVKNPDTIRTLEAFGAAHVVMAVDVERRLQIGPMVMGGVIRELRAQDGRSLDPGTVAGAGVRIARDGSELHILAGWTSILPDHNGGGGAFAVMTAAHLKVGGAYVVADAIVGPTWVLRSGVAVRAF
jgi:hypothetical protein